MTATHSAHDLVERLFGKDAPRVACDGAEVWGHDGRAPHYVALIPEDLGDDPTEYPQAALDTAEYFGATVGSLPGFVRFYDGHIEEAELLEADGGVVVSGTVASVEGDDVMAFDAAITGCPDGLLFVVAFSHLPRRDDDPRLDLEALGFGAPRHLRYVGFTVGAG